MYNAHIIAAEEAQHDWHVVQWGEQLSHEEYDAHATAYYQAWEAE